MSSITYQRNGAVRTVPTGFSVATLFFGPLPAMIRGQWVFASAMMICELVALLVLVEAGDLQGFTFLACIALRIFFAGMRNSELNELYVKDGWKTQDEIERSKGYYRNHYKRG